MYVADYFTLPAGRTWVAMPLHQKLPDAGQWRWALLDQIAGFLGYIADERLMRELTYNPGSTTAPDGVPVRGARARGPSRTCSPRCPRHSRRASATR
ncbi:hypothetical protein ACFQX7_39120 [Luedemannella flava]